MSDQTMEDLWVCLGYWCNKHPVCVYDVCSSTQKEELLKKFDATAIEAEFKYSSLDELEDIECEMYYLTPKVYSQYFYNNDRGCCKPIIYFVKKNNHTIRELTKYIESDNC